MRKLWQWREWERWKYFNQNTRRLLFASAFVGLTYEGIVIVLYNLYVLRLGYGPEFIGIANSAGLLTFAITSLIVGLIGVGKRVRQLMIWGLVVIIGGIALLPVAEIAPQSWQATLVVGCNILYHIGVSCYFVSVPPFIMHNTSSKEHLDVLAVESTAFSISAFTGSVLGGFIPQWLAPTLSVSSDHPAPFRWTFILAMFLLVPAIVALFGTDSQVIRRDVPKQSAVEKQDVGGNTAVTPTRLFITFVIIMTLVRIIQSAGMNTSFTYFNVYFDNQLGIDTRIIGLITGAARLLGAGLVFSMPIVVRRWGEEAVLIVISLVGAGGLLLLGYSPVWWMAGVGQLIALGMNSMRFTLFTSYVMEESPMRWHSLMAGLNETTGGLGFASMALLGGYIITSQGYATLFLSGAVLLALGTMIFWIYVRLYPSTSQAIILNEPA